MSERYSRLFSLPENLYAEGAPVIIAAGALLKDNQTGNVLAQLKLQNICNQIIKAATVRIFPMDTVTKRLHTNTLICVRNVILPLGKRWQYPSLTPLHAPFLWG